MIRHTLCGLALAFLTASAAAAAPASDVMTPLKQIFDGLNRGDFSSAITACSTPSTVIDEFPPFHWQGRLGCADWARDLVRLEKTEGATGLTVTLGKPVRTEVDAGRAYVMVPASLTYVVKGKRFNELHAVVTATLQRTDNAWRITGWTWTSR